MKILIIENNEDFRHFTERMFIRKGFEVTVAIDCCEAYSKITDLQPDLILSAAANNYIKNYQFFESIENEDLNKSYSLYLRNNMNLAVLKNRIINRK